ncbi:uncharacterized protein LOC132070791 [Ammospiza nelsoni]|uniref:uncharacterized protein LOC132070791 n=1 Tax=Ammospiza nelsoni TaxID=2857394 RepID=UPI0028699799|nr:uncharacterized protein LOC132070791 [Ammospiza nelsoni]
MQGGEKGSGGAISRGGAAAEQGGQAAAVQAGGAGKEITGDMSSGVAFVSATPGAAAAPAGRVAEMRAKGRTRKDPGGESQTSTGVLDTGGELGEAAQPQRATVGRRRRRAVVKSDPVRRSARIAEWARGPAGGGLCTPVGEVVTASEEEETESGTDRGEETSEVEQGGESDVSSGETGSGSESTHARRAERGRGRASSPVTSRARRGRARDSTSRDSTPSPDLADSVSDTAVNRKRKSSRAHSVIRAGEAGDSAT